MRNFGSFFKTAKSDEDSENDTKTKSTKQDKKETKFIAEIEIGYKHHTNILTCDLDQFSILTLDDVCIVDPIGPYSSTELTSIDGFDDPISQQILRFPNEKKHAIILFICDREIANDQTDYILNKRKNSYYVVKYAGSRCDLIYVDNTGEELNVNSIRYKSKHITIYPHQILMGCCNEVPLFYFKNKGRIKLTFSVRPIK